MWLITLLGGLSVLCSVLVLVFAAKKRMKSADLPADSRTCRREIAAGLVAFLAGLFAALIGLAVLMFRIAPSEQPWLKTLLTMIRVLPIAVLAGLGLATAAVGILSSIHFRQGVYRCIYCDRPLRNIGVPCECRQHGNE